MKKVLFSALISIGLLAAQSVTATGFHIQGYVNTNGTTYMNGSMNNRYSTAATTSTTYIYANGSANSSVAFAGRTGNGTSFYCFVPTTSAIYADAKAIKNNLRNGGYIYVTKLSTSSECNYVYSLNTSYFLD